MTSQKIKTKGLFNVKKIFIIAFFLYKDLLLRNKTPIMPTVFSKCVLHESYKTYSMKKITSWFSF